VFGVEVQKLPLQMNPIFATSLIADMYILNALQRNCIRKVTTK